MRLLWLPVAILSAQAVVWPAATGYRERRSALTGKLNDGVVVLFGRTDNQSEDDRTGFAQDPNFYYLSGWQEPGAILLLSPADDILFVPSPNARHERYMGPTLNPGSPDAVAVTGFATVLAVERFESELARALQTRPRLYASSEEAAEKLRRLAPLREVASATDALARLRMVKSEAELELIGRSIDATIEAFRTVWRRAAPGLYEYQLAASMVEVYADRGCQRSAYAPIVAAGPDAVILHYSRNSRRVEKGDLVLMDVGAECSGYAADITRTIPADRHFSPRQRELYDVVLGAGKAAIAAVRPGATLAELTNTGRQYMEAHGHLGKYFTHGISHHVGLEVHDAADASAPLAEGMVITIEPGVYIPEENIGIRIEDMVLVTAGGARVLTAALPREAGEVERAMAR